LEQDLPVFFPNQHFMDKAIKWLLRERRNMEDLLSVLAPDLKDSLDFSLYETMDRSFISEEFREKESDALFKVGHRKEDEEAKESFIYLLLEHQSRPDSQIRFRFHRAQTAIWTYFTDRYEQAKKKGEEVDFVLPPVVCLLFYTGKDRWNIPSLAQAFGFDEAFYPYTPEQTIISLGLHMFDGEKLISSATPIGQSCRLITITEFEKDAFKEAVKEINFMFLNEDDRVAYRKFIHFMVSLVYHRREPEERDEMIEFIKSIIIPEEVTEVETMKKTIADVIFEQGIEKGIEKGIETGIETGIEKGITTGELAKARADILRILKARFGAVKEEIAEKVGPLDSMEKLDSLIDLAATCESLEGFERGM